MAKRNSLALPDALGEFCPVKFSFVPMSAAALLVACGPADPSSPEPAGKQAAAVSEPAPAPAAEAKTAPKPPQPVAPPAPAAEPAPAPAIMDCVGSNA